MAVMERTRQRSGRDDAPARMNIRSDGGRQSLFIVNRQQFIVYSLYLIVTNRKYKYLF